MNEVVISIKQKRNVQHTLEESQSYMYMTCYVR